MSPRSRLTGPDRLPVAPLQAAFRASGQTPSEMCLRMGWVRHDGDNAGHPATANLNYALGLKPSMSRNKRLNGTTAYHRSFATTIDKGKALEICAAMGVAFDDVYDMPLAEPRPRGGLCECGEKMVRSADRCGFCEAEQSEMAA